MNLFEYIEKFGDVTFNKKPYNEVDNLIFSSISYLDYTYTSINRGEHTLEYIGNEYLKTNEFKVVKKLGISQKYGYKLLRKLIKAKRYKDLIVHDYEYNYDKEKQFSAMMIRINPKLEYISYEGTDELVSGWKEDFELSYRFPIPSQVDAIEYANKHIKFKGPDILIGGHSKGGNLALVAAMYTNILKQRKIKRIYNNDGPGLRTKEFNSLEYKRIRKKIVHYVPEYSLFGILLRHETMSVIRSTKKTFFAHAIGTWLVDDENLLPSKLSKRSTELQENMLVWLSNHTNEEKERMVKDIFKLFEDNGIDRVCDMISISNIRKVINKARDLNDKSKNSLKEFFRYTFLNKKDGKDM